MNDERYEESSAIRQPRPHAGEMAWFRDANLPHSREDMIAEAIALVALLFALGIGLVIALLPASAKAATPIATAAAPAAAASAPSLELSAFKIVPAAKDKPEHLVAAAQAHGGDQLEYRAVYRNPTKAAVHHVVITVPVPENGVEYVMESATPRADQASSDGKQFAALPLQRVETAADGTKVAKPAPSADYRFLRWDLGDVPAGATRTVSTRVKLLTTTVATR
jgi:hypothetical protein